MSSNWLEIRQGSRPETCIAEWSKRRRTHLAGETYVVSSREREHRHQAGHVDQNRRDFDAFYVDCDHDDRHADEPQTPIGCTTPSAMISARSYSQLICPGHMSGDD